MLLASAEILPAPDANNFRTFAIALSAISISAVLGLTVVSVASLKSGTATVSTLPVQAAVAPVQYVVPQSVAAVAGGAAGAEAGQQPATQQAALPQQPPVVTGPTVEEMVAAARAQAQALQQPTTSADPVLQQQATIDPSAPTLTALLANPESGAAILQSLSLAAGIEMPGEADNGTPIYAFFDPRCPYCHAAYKEINGMFRIKWLPTLALGVTPEGEGTIAALLGQTEAGMDGGQMVAATLPDDPERADRLNAVLNSERLEPAEITDAQRFIIDENLQIALQLYDYHSEPFGVPTFIVPKPDGTAVLVRGWDPTGSVAEIQAAYGDGS